ALSNRKGNGTKSHAAASAVNRSLVVPLVVSLSLSSCSLHREEHIQVRPPGLDSAKDCADASGFKGASESVAAELITFCKGELEQGFRSTYGEVDACAGHAGLPHRTHSEGAHLVMFCRCMRDHGFKSQ